ncbi:MAG: Gldg family protein [Rubripirellula sp.]
MKLRTQVVGAIFRRNFSAYFSGMLGYLFIVVFVIAAGFLAFNAQFFTANEPSLDQLSNWFPVLLLFFIPAITMSVWADERKTGTDELLFTMPATDLEILLGKYFAVLAVYSVALVFSMSHLFVLNYLGNPDWGLLATTYFGYWIAGAALLSAGMLASLLTNNMTVAFVVGMVICAIPVFIGQLGSFLGIGQYVERFSLQDQFRDLGMGVIPLTSIVYFLGFTLLMLYLNLVFMSRRNWKSDARGSTGTQFGIRAACLGVIAACVVAWAGYMALRVDATSEKLFSLSPSTRAILKGLESERPIEIQAFLSPEVPREYAETRKRLVGLLRQFDELGGKNLEVRYVDVEQFSEQAEEAEHFGIQPISVGTEQDGRRTQAEVYLGAVAISSYDKVVVPFFGKGLPIEYELTRSVQTVADDSRLTVGILRTDAALLDGAREWRIVTELKKQYNVEEISPTAEIDASKIDVLLAAMPSSLTDPEMANLVSYVQAGNPVLIFDDPFPISFSTGMGISGAPRQPKPSQGGGGMFGGQSPPPTPKADGGRATRLLSALGLNWQYDQAAFDVSNPHPEFGMLPAEYIFVTRGGSNKDAFNDENKITSGLQELIVLYGGTVASASDKVTVEPLIQTGYESGVLAWQDFVDEGGMNFMSMQPTASPLRNPRRRIDSSAHTLAVRVKGNSDDNKANAVFVSDIDMISDFFFEERNLGNLGIKFDNVTFVLNAVDALAGDEDFIDLRSRRPKHRTLVRVEQQKRSFLEAANKAEKDADEAATEELEKRREQLTKRVKEIEENEALDPIAKQQMLRQAQEAEQQRMTLAEAKIDQEKNDSIRKIRGETDNQVRALESRIRFWAVWLPAIPALLIGVIVFANRWRDEKTTVVSSRRRDERRQD